MKNLYAQANKLRRVVKGVNEFFINHFGNGEEAAKELNYLTHDRIKI